LLKTARSTTTSSIYEREIDTHSIGSVWEAVNEESCFANHGSLEVFGAAVHEVLTDYVVARMTEVGDQKVFNLYFFLKLSSWFSGLLFLWYRF
jgi:hypothetical protein